jgi:hypothetical protein
MRPATEQLGAGPMTVKITRAGLGKVNTRRIPERFPRPPGRRSIRSNPRAPARTRPEPGADRTRPRAACVVAPLPPTWTIPPGALPDWGVDLAAGEPGTLAGVAPDLGVEDWGC